MLSLDQKPKLMKKALFMVLAVTILFACRQKTVVLAGDTDPEEEMLSTTKQNCYQYIKGRDTASLNLTVTGKNASGDLAYSWFQKDKNTGTIDGRLHGDTIIANYKFMSEGKESIRQVVFLNQGDKLVEGVGEIKLEGNNTMYQDLSMLNFDGTIVMRKVPCK